MFYNNSVNLLPHIYLLYFDVFQGHFRWKYDLLHGSTFDVGSGTANLSANNAISNNLTYQIYVNLCNII